MAKLYNKERIEEIIDEILFVDKVINKVSNITSIGYSNLKISEGGEITITLEDDGQELFIANHLYEEFKSFKESIDKRLLEYKKSLEEEFEEL